MQIFLKYLFLLLERCRDIKSLLVSTLWLFCYVRANNPLFIFGLTHLPYKWTLLETILSLKEGEFNKS